VEVTKTGFVQGKGGGTHAVDPRYLDWIADYCGKVASDPSFVGNGWTLASRLHGSCGAAAQEMRSAFPELLLIRGTTASKIWLNQMGYGSSGEDLQELIDPSDGHIWLETQDGLIVDPTGAQFGAQGDRYYIAFDESRSGSLPTGTCPNCGDYAYNGDVCCSEACGSAYVNWINRECGI